jgi:hypothetical protein
MELQMNMDLPKLLEKVNNNIDFVNDIIKSKEEELNKILKFKDSLKQEKKDILEKINKIKKEKELKEEIEREKKNLIVPSLEEKEDNSPATIYDYYTIQDLKGDTSCFNFGDIVDTSCNRHYGFKFVGKNGSFQNTTRRNSVDHEEGLTVPIEISKYLIDTVSKYSNLDYELSSILAYELPYNDVTVQKYKVKKNYMYEYVCWDYKNECYDIDKWYLEQINIETGKRTKPRKRRNK